MMAGRCAAAAVAGRAVGMREPGDNELAAFDAVTLQDGRLTRPVQDRLGQVRRWWRDGRRPGRRFRAATDAGAAVAAAATAATATTTRSHAVALVVVVVDELGHRRVGDGRMRGGREFLRRRKEKFLKDGRAGRITFVADRQRLGRNAVLLLLLGPSASKGFVEGAPSGQDFRGNVVPPDGQERSRVVGSRRRTTTCRRVVGHSCCCCCWAGGCCCALPLDVGRGCRDLVVLLE